MIVGNRILNPLDVNSRPLRPGRRSLGNVGKRKARYELLRVGTVVWIVKANLLIEYGVQVKTTKRSRKIKARAWVETG